MRLCVRVGGGLTAPRLSDGLHVSYARGQHNTYHLNYESALWLTVKGLVRMWKGAVSVGQVWYRCGIGVVRNRSGSDVAGV